MRLPVKSSCREDLIELRLLESVAEHQLITHDRIDYSFFDALSNAICLFHSVSFSAEKDELSCKTLPPGFETYIKNKNYQNKWNSEKLIEMIDPVLRSELKMLVNTITYSTTTTAPYIMNITDPLTLKIIVDLCKKLNLHVAVYNIKHTTGIRNQFELEDNTCVYDDMVNLGDQVLSVKPRPMINKTINVDGSSMTPRKISIAYRHARYPGIYVDSKQPNSAYSLILSKTSHSDEIIIDEISNPYKSPLADIAPNFIVHDYRVYVNMYASMRQTVQSMVNFVFEGDSDDVHDVLHDEKNLITDAHSNTQSKPSDLTQIVLEGMMKKHQKLKGSIEETSVHIDNLIKRKAYLKQLLDAFQCMMRAEETCINNLHMILKNVTKNHDNGFEQNPELLLETTETLSIVSSVMESLHIRDMEIKKMMSEIIMEIKKKQLVNTMKTQNLTALNKYISDLHKKYITAQEINKDQRTESNIDADGFITPHRRNRNDK